MYRLQYSKANKMGVAAVSAGFWVYRIGYSGVLVLVRDQLCHSARPFWQCHFGGRPAILAVYAKSYSVCDFIHVCETIQGMYARAYLHLLLLPVISVRVRVRVRGITGLY